MSDESEAKQNRTVAIDWQLHRQLKMIAVRKDTGMKELVEKPLRLLVEENRDWLEQMTGEASAR